MLLFIIASVIVGDTCCRAPAVDVEPRFAKAAWIHCLHAIDLERFLDSHLHTAELDVRVACLRIHHRDPFALCNASEPLPGMDREVARAAGLSSCDHCRPGL